MDFKSQRAIKIQGFEPTCPICFEPWASNIVPWTLACGHMICEGCLMKHKLTTKKCHMCREKFTIRNQRRQRQKAFAKRKRGRIKERIQDELDIYHEKTSYDA